MAKKKPLRFNSATRAMMDTRNSEMSLFDLDNPDIGLFDLIDDELVRLAGSPLVIYKYMRDDNFDDVYQEDTQKVISKQGIQVEGFYDPRPVEESLAGFGLEIENDQVFTFNKSYIEYKLQRPLIAGDVIKPKFQNILYEVYEVQEESFDIYGVFHLIAAAKILRDQEQIRPASDFNSENKSDTRM